MDNEALHTRYLQRGTAGRAVIDRFYSRYADALAKAGFDGVDDVVHEVFVSLSKTDFTNVHNPDHYVLRAVKLRCWSLLDKALRRKATMAGNEPLSEGDQEIPPLHSGVIVEQEVSVEGMELVTVVNLFKAQLNPRDMRLLNLLIDETARTEIANLLGVNLNTLDTNIRRLRIRLADFLKELGYTYTSIGRFS